MLAHESEITAFFAQTSGAMTTWARFRATPGDEGELVHMPAGRGERFRRGTEAGQYRCPLTECDGLLVVHAGEKNIHHWQHRTALPVEHSPETLWHLTAKALLADFARDQRPGATVNVDNQFTDRGRNKPDVWVRWKSDDEQPGGDVAFEAQHSALDPGKLDMRNATYAEDGIVPVWLFAHLAAPELTMASDLVGLHREHQVAAGTGPLRWLNPDQGMIATGYVAETERPDVHRGEAWGDSDVERILYVRHADRTDRQVRIRIDALDNCVLDAAGIHTPADLWIAEQSSLADAAELAALAAYREHHAGPAQHSRPGDQEASRAEGPHDVASERVPSPVPSFPVYPRHDPQDQPCPYCAGPIRTTTEWPHWYRPPADATEVFECSACGLILGSR